jgi:hypothetical protein
MGYFPGSKSKHVDKILFDSSIRKNISFFTRKQIVRKAIGSYCFLIVGAGKKDKEYYLWSFSLIKKVTDDEEEENVLVGSGPGFNFRKPILLNDLPNYSDFKNFCGNFGIGFQNITKHDFCRTLIEFAAINSLPG